MVRITAMISHHPGRYTTSRLRLMACSIPALHMHETLLAVQTDSSEECRPAGRKKVRNGYVAPFAAGESTDIPSVNKNSVS
jgi:hypothetical protein